MQIYDHFLFSVKVWYLSSGNVEKNGAGKTTHSTQIFYEAGSAFKPSRSTEL